MFRAGVKGGLVGPRVTLEVGYHPPVIMFSLVCADPPSI